MPTIFRDKVVVGSTTFNDPTALPVGAYRWGIDVLDGWRETPELDALVTPWGGQVDGGVASPYFAARPRYLVAGGYVVATSRARAEELWDVLVRDVFPRNRSVRLERHESVPKWVTVRRVGPLVPPQDLGDAFRFSVDLVAPDPFKYSLEPTVVGANVKGTSSTYRSYPRTYPLTYVGLSAQESSDHAVVVNAGTAPAYPVITVRGPLPQGGWRLENSTTGETITFDVGLNTGDLLVIDFRQQVATLNGVPVTASVVGTFWRVEGATTVRLYAPYDPDAGFTIRVYSAWE